MEPIQLAALSAMLSKKLVVETDLPGVVQIQLDMFSQRLLESVQRYVKENNELILFLSEELPKIPLAGKAGLKDRSGLKEYRYDYV